MDQKRSPNKRLFIGSLPYRFTEGELLSLFVPFGKVVSLKIMHNRWGKSRGMGFIEFDTLDSAILAKEKMHQYKLGDLAIIVDYAEPDPFLTPEGKARHEEALERHPQRRQSENIPVRSAPKRKMGLKHFSSPQKVGHQRQSVFDSRYHHSKVGAKFAKRNKSK